MLAAADGERRATSPLVAFALMRRGVGAACSVHAAHGTAAPQSERAARQSAPADLPFACEPGVRRSCGCRRTRRCRRPARAFACGVSLVSLLRRRLNSGVRGSRFEGGLTYG